MPTTRRSTARTGSTKGQSTISFTNKVTKPVAKNVKSVVATPKPATVDIPERTKPIEEKTKEDVNKKDENEAEHEHEEESQQQAPRLETAPPIISETETRAGKLTDAHINKYWKSIERQRKASRVHQQGISVNEKVLRYFDVSSQYGRWNRAERLGLNPPVEVLAVLLKEHKKPNDEVEMAQMDSILNSIAVGP
ncbi:uncharacterized protein CPUR_00318 [Claviceps purpurea 20.1]|uniref:DNA polymerase delta subunit 4 n=1 Tax=Claviceps purpurea (strain 20.1) TaxID=1111077 RepID=M1W8Z7_CLAP2|nr:uncharacterized protein CPUR_00318 [Claviceps purpurea 20.1]